MFKNLKKTKNNTITFVKENAPHIILNIIGVAAVVFVYHNYTEKQHAAYVNHLDNVETTFQETSDSWLASQTNEPITK